MKVFKFSLIGAALALAFAAPAFAQATPPAGAAKPQTASPAKPQTAPAAPAPAAQQPPAPKPQPPVPFPQDAKYAFVDVQAVASQSTAGKAASSRLKALTDEKQKAIIDKTKQLQALQARQQSAGILNDAARAQLDKDIDKLQREIQFDQSNAQADLQSLNNDLMNDFQQKLAPIIEEIAKEKGLYMVFTPESGFAYVNPGLDITAEVVKRLDAKK
jgi:Skp family chaperone for outer membrane proteins